MSCSADDKDNWYSMQLLCEMAPGLRRTCCHINSSKLSTKELLLWCMVCRRTSYLESIGGSNSMRQLCRQWRGDCVKVELLAAVVYWHLPSFAMPMLVPIALSSDARQEVSVHAAKGSSDQVMLC